MKPSILFRVSLVVVLAACFLSLNINAQETKKVGQTYIQNDYPTPRQGGDNVASAVQILSLPYTDNGTTCGYTGDYSGGCGYSEFSPDVVYYFSATSTGTIDVIICPTNYDPVVYVFENNISTVIACNDDASPAGCFVLDAAVYAVPVTAGNTYYVVVDGYYGNCGDYVLNVSGILAPPIETPVSNWALLAGIGMILIFAVIRFRKIF